MLRAQERHASFINQRNGIHGPAESRITRIGSHPSSERHFARQIKVSIPKTNSRSKDMLCFPRHWTPCRSPKPGSLWPAIRPWHSKFLIRWSRNSTKMATTMHGHRAPKLFGRERPIHAALGGRRGDLPDIQFRRLHRSHWLHV
jgi:hypothetical protein